MLIFFKVLADLKTQVQKALELRREKAEEKESGTKGEEGEKDKTRNALTVRSQENGAVKQIDKL